MDSFDLIFFSDWLKTEIHAPTFYWTTQYKKKKNNMKFNSLFVTLPLLVSFASAESFLRATTTSSSRSQVRRESLLYSNRHNMYQHYYLQLLYMHCIPFHFYFNSMIIPTSGGYRSSLRETSVSYTMTATTVPEKTFVMPTRPVHRTTMVNGPLV